MARANKYSSVNFNHVYDKNLTNNGTPNTANNTTKQPSSSSSSALYSAISSPNTYKNHLSSSRSHGRMLVLTRPSPKPVSSVATQPTVSPSPQIPSTQQPQVPNSDQARSEPETDQISLRPLGRTGAAPCVSSPVLVPEREKEVAPLVGSPKPDKFVPPHLRPGFAGREERPGPEVFRGKEAIQRPHPPQQQDYFVSAGEYGRPKSGGYERMKRGGESDLGLMNRPRSSGNRPNSSGWYGSRQSNPNRFCLS